MSKLDIISITLSLLSVFYLIDNEVDLKFFRWIIKLCALLLYIVLICVFK